MYEELIEFLLGRKEELTDDDLDEFVDLLASALEVTEEYDIHKKQSLIANMVNRTNVVDKKEQAEIASAIDRILQFDEADEEEVDIFENEEEASVPLRSRKFTRGQARHAKAEEEDGPEPRVKNQKGQISVKMARRMSSSAPRAAPAPLDANTETISSSKAGHKHKDVESSLEQEDLLKSVCSDFRSPEKRQKLPNGQTVKFSELFSAKSSSAGSAARPEEKPGDEGEPDEFEFDIGEMEENHNEGPEYVFKIDDSMEQ